MSNKLRVYFMGSGNIAVPILQMLAHGDDSLELVGVGTQPDRPAGRKCKLLPTPVGAAANSLGIEADRIESASSPEFVAKLQAMQLDFILVVSFGQILRQNVLDVPKFGCINVHASVLPKYRGASPICAAIARREPFTGVTFMRMVRQLDAGAIYHIIKYPLSGHERCDELELQLGIVAAANTIDTLHGIASGSFAGVEQDESAMTMTCKIKKQDGLINWNWPAETIEAVTRAFYPWPGAIMTLMFGDREERLTIHSAQIVEGVNETPGTIVRADKNGFIIACKGGAVELLELTPAGRKTMSAIAYLNGCKITEVTVKVDLGE